MIADSNGDMSGDTRPLWITGLSPPDSWRSLRQPGYLQLDQVLTLDDGRSSQARSRAFVAASKSTIPDALGAKTPIATLPCRL